MGCRSSKNTGYSLIANPIPSKKRYKSQVQEFIAKFYAACKEAGPCSSLQRYEYVWTSCKRPRTFGLEDSFNVSIDYTVVEVKTKIVSIRGRIMLNFSKISWSHERDRDFTLENFEKFLASLQYHTVKWMKVQGFQEEDIELMLRKGYPVGKLPDGYVLDREKALTLPDYVPRAKEEFVKLFREILSDNEKLFLDSSEDFELEKQAYQERCRHDPFSESFEGYLRRNPAVWEKILDRTLKKE